MVSLATGPPPLGPHSCCYCCWPSPQRKPQCDCEPHAPDTKCDTSTVRCRKAGLASTATTLDTYTVVCVCVCARSNALRPRIASPPPCSHKYTHAGQPPCAGAVGIHCYCCCQSANPFGDSRHHTNDTNTAAAVAQDNECPSTREPNQQTPGSRP